ncbi:GIP [Symbiodinium sp. CCMP2592]|nr:GIP [Symbiodinium sp. CCMP2592]
MAHQDDGTNTADHDDALAQAMDEEFEEARDGNTSVSPEDERSQRLFPDSEPLDPPYGLRATGASLEFGLDAAALGLLDGGSGSSTEQTATRHFSPQSDHELIPATEEPRSVAAGRMPQVTAPPPAVTNDLMGQLSAMLQQTLQSHVAPALDRMMMSQAAVMSRLDRLESERDSQVPLTAQGEHVLAMLQSLEVGSKPSASGANADAALKQPTTVPAGVLPESAVGVQDTCLHHARDLASKGNGSAHVQAPTHQNKGVTVVEGGEASGIRGFGLDPSPGIGEKPEEPTKTSLELPKLDKYNPSTSAIVAGDWLISLTPVITSLSASAWVFWEDCVSTAKLFYGRWLSSSPLERLHIQAEVLVNRYRDGKFSRVDQRAVSLLLAAVGNELKDDLISLRLLGTCAIVFKVMAKYQPGGAAEKQQLLSFLVTPENVTTSAASVKALRKWRRWLARARELQVIVPDPSLQLKGLERLAPTLSAPTQQTVLQFSELLLAEAEEAVLSEAADKGGARQTVAKADEVPGKGGKVGKEGKGASKGAAKVDGVKQLCRLWRTDDGCRYGKSCTFAHDALTPADKRCFNCSSTKHRKPDCPFPRAQAEPGGKPGKGSQKGKSGDEVMKAQDKGASETDKSARDELIARANAVLESIQTSIKALQLGSKYPPKPGPRDETGLIDSGATTCMRMRREDEQPVGEKTVSLAQGEVQMGFSAGGVLLANEEVEPIVSLRQLITIGFRLVWSKRACQLFDEEGYSVPLSTASGCPRVCKAVAQNLIDRIETFNLHGYGEDQLAMMRDADAVSWEAVMCKVAESVREGRHEFDAVAAKHGAKVVAIDSTEDLNDPATYTYLLKQALAGKDEGPPVVRARYGVERFGLENLSHQEREKVDYDDQLMLRSFILGVASKWGPFKRGTHEGAKASYFLAAVFSVPRAPELNGSRVDKPEADVAAVPGEPGEWENADDDDRDDDDGGGVGPIELDDAPVEPEPQPLEQLELVHLPFVVPLPSKGARDVMNGIKGIEARLCAMGCHVARLHSDAGKEFCNNMLRTWAKERGMHKTNTGGDRFKANPFAENLIGILKGCARTLMKESDVSDQDWPYAIRHACAQRFRDQAVKLGWDIPRLIPFGAKVHVLQRSWNLARGGDWKSRVVEAKVLAPARELSAGYLVRTVEDTLLNVPCVYEDLVHTNPEEFHIPAEKAKPASPAVIPDVRVRRKTSLSARRAEKPAADESVAMLDGLLSEDEHASCLASIEPFDVERFSKDPMKQLQSVMMFALRGLTNQLKAGDIVAVPAMYARYGDEGSSQLRVKVVGEMRVVVMLSVEMRVVVRVVVILRVLMAVVVTLRVIVMTPESLVEGPVVSSGTSGFSGSAGWEDVSCDPLGDCEFVDVSVTSNLLFCEPTCVEWESIVGRASDREVGPDDHDTSGETWVGVGEASESFDPDGQQIALQALLSRECKLQDRSGVAGDSDREGYIHGLSSTIKRLEERCCKADDGVEYSTLPDAEVLTTHTVPLEEVERHYSLWSAAVQAELDSLVHEKQAVRVITSAEMQAMQEKGTCVTIIPSKMVFTRKAGGRHKARLVACGNHLDGQGQAKGKQSPSKANLYAGGIDPSVMRQAASIAVKRAWKGGATDITTAFLNAELLDRVNPRSSPPPLSLDVPTEVIVLKIPSIVHRHGHVDRSCFMLVCKALYGLDQSPRDWSIKRDSEIEGMSCQVDGVTCMFEQSLVDSNLWYLRRVPKDGESHSWREPVACMLVYVDDLLAFGPSPVLTMIFELITSRWKCGPVEWIPEDPTKPPLKFFGFELRWDGKDLLLGQQDFIRDVATRYPEATASCVPATPGPLDVEDASERRPEDVSACQTALGEILWVAGRTRPDIIFAVSRLAQTMSRDPATVRKRVMQLIGYLVYTQDLCLRYRATYSCQGEPGATATPNAEGVIEAMTDSAFAPVCERSQESTLVYTQGSLTGWNTGRQPFTAASTAESELLSLMTGFSFGRAQTYVLQEFMGKVPRLVVLNDNMASISIVNGDSNGWRSRHLRIRAHVLREQAKQGHVVVGHIEGAKNIADAGTKALPYPRLKLLRDGMGLDAVRNVHDARPKGATKVIDPASAAKIQAVVLTLAAVTAEAQQSPDEPEGHSHELWFLMFLVCCTSIALWEGLKWACRWCCRRRRVQRRAVERHEPEEERSSDGENQPDDEDELQEFSPQAADRVEDHDVARELTVPPEGTVVRYVDDVMYVGPPPEEEEERLRRRRQGQRVYHDEPDFEPAAVEASGLPPWNVQNRVRQALEAQRDARGSNEGPNWMPNQFVNYPVIRLRADWPASENQPPLAYLAAYQSAWGGLASALHQLRPNDAYTRDEYTRHDARQNVLIRWHFGWRVMLFDPNRTTSPVAMSRLTGRRRTVITYSDGTEELLDDNFRIDSARRMMDQQWVGRTELEIREGT